MTINIEQLNEQLKGVMPFAPTPFSMTDQEVDLAGFKKNLTLLVDHKVDSIGVCGFAGEFAAISLEEYGQLMKAAVEVAGGKALIMAGVGHGTKTAIAYARVAQEQGADCIMILPPYVSDAPADGLYNHNKAIAKSVEIGVMLHSMPGGANLTPEVIARLSELDNVVAYKDELRDINRFHEIRWQTGEDIAYVSANGEKLIEYYFLYGNVGLATAMGNFDPGVIMTLYRCLEDRDHSSVKKILQEKIIPWYTLRERDRGMLISVTKESMNMLGLCGGVPRLPLMPVGEKERKELAELMNYLGYA